MKRGMGIAAVTTGGNISYGRCMSGTYSALPLRSKKISYSKTFYLT